MKILDTLNLDYYNKGLGKYYIYIYMNYKTKYLKYKIKYINLKMLNPYKLSGGTLSDKEETKIVDGNDQYILGLKLYNPDTNGYTDHANAKKQFESAAHMGHAEAMYMLGEMLYKGQGGNKNYKYAKSIFNALADKGNAKAQFMLGEMLYKGQGGEKEEGRAREMYGSAAAKGNDDAQFMLGAMLYNNGGKENYKKAEAIFKSLAEKDNAKAQYMLGGMLYNGDGRPKNYRRAKKWFTLAAKNGHSESEIILDIMARNQYLKRISLELISDDSDSIPFNAYGNEIVSDDDNDVDEYEKLETVLEREISADATKIKTILSDTTTTINYIIEIINKYTPDTHVKSPGDYNTYIKEFLLKQLFIKYFSFAIPSLDSIFKIKDFVNTDQILEIGAGNGLWAGLLTFVGCDIIATDNWSKNWKTGSVKYIDVENLDENQAIEKYHTANVLFLCWPPTDGMAYNSIKLFKGGKLIYIGERVNDTVTGGAAFHQMLSNDWTESLYIKIPTWRGGEDAIYLYTRK
jgi:hypothetical protein